MVGAQEHSLQRKLDVYQRLAVEINLLRNYMYSVLSDSNLMENTSDLSTEIRRRTAYVMQTMNRIQTYRKILDSIPTVDVKTEAFSIAKDDLLHVMKTEQQFIRNISHCTNQLLCRQERAVNNASFLEKESDLVEKLLNSALQGVSKESQLLGNVRSILLRDSFTQQAKGICMIISNVFSVRIEAQLDVSSTIEDKLVVRSLVITEPFEELRNGSEIHYLNGQNNVGNGNGSSSNGNFATTNNHINVHLYNKLTDLAWVYLVQMPPESDIITNILLWCLRYHDLMSRSCEECKKLLYHDNDLQKLMLPVLRLKKKDKVTALHIQCSQESVDE